MTSLKKIRFTKIHTFPYSIREGTPAAKMKDQIDGNIKKKRVREVLELSKQFEYEYYSKYINTIISGVIEEHQNGTFMVHSSNFIPVIIDGNNLNSGDIVDVKIVKVDKENNVYGKIKNGLIF